MNYKVQQAVAMAIADAQGDTCWHEPNSFAAQKFSMRVAQSAIKAYLAALHAEKGEG